MILTNFLDRHFFRLSLSDYFWKIYTDFTGYMYLLTLLPKLVELTKKKEKERKPKNLHWYKKFNMLKKQVN